MTIRRLLRTVPALAALGPAILGLSAAASAAPTVSFSVSAMPIPGFPGTGDILGAGAVIQGEATVTGREYGGNPPPLIEIRFYAPAGAKLHPQGFPTCAPSVIERSGPSACPKKSAVGPKGSANGVVSFVANRAGR